MVGMKKGIDHDGWGVAPRDDQKGKPLSQYNPSHPKKSFAVCLVYVPEVSYIAISNNPLCGPKTAIS